MLELALGKVGNSLETTSMLARDIYHEVRKETAREPDKKIDEKLAIEAKTEQSGVIEKVDDSLEKTFKEIQWGEKSVERVERKTAIFLFRVLSAYVKDMNGFAELKKQLLKLFEGDDITTRKINFIMDELIAEQNRIHNELLSFARIMKDQEYGNHRLRDEIIIAVAKHTQERRKSRRLRRDFRKEKHEGKAVEHDESLIKNHLNVLYNTHKGTEKDKQIIRKAINDLTDHLAKEDNYLERLMGDIEFVLKMAITLMYNLMDREVKVEDVIAHLHQLEFPERHIELFNKKWSDNKQTLASNLQQIMHMMYQLLHKESGMTKAA